MTDGLNEFGCGIQRFGVLMALSGAAVVVWALLEAAVEGVVGGGVFVVLGLALAVCWLEGEESVTFGCRVRQWSDPRERCERPGGMADNLLTRSRRDRS